MDVGMTNQKPFSGSLVSLFHSPTGTFLPKEPLCDKYGSVVDIKINGKIYYAEESPFITQPDYLLDNRTGLIIGLCYQLSSPSWMISRCNKMLSKAMTDMMQLTNDPTGVWLDVIWGESTSYKRVFAQLDFGLWGFLYNIDKPSKFLDSDAWTPPAGILISDLSQLDFPASIKANEIGDTVIEPIYIK